MKKEINIQEVTCEKIRENIESCSKAIRIFAELMNNHLPNKLDLKKMQFHIFVETDNGAYENDGNTACMRKRYSVYWFFDLTGKKNKPMDLWSVDRRTCENSLYFTFEQSERIHDASINGSRFFNLYLSGMKKTGREEFCNRIDYNNNNYSLLSIVNIVNAATCIQEVKKITEFYNLVTELDDEIDKL